MSWSKTCRIWHLFIHWIINQFEEVMKSPLILATSVLLASLCSSCVSFYELPAGHSGPTAVIRSSGKPVNSVKAEGYYIVSVNGKSARHSPMATPYGAGMGVSLEAKSIQVPCEPLELKLSGGNVYAADGVAMADTLVGGNHSVSGNVTFTPKPNGDYTVTGTTGKGYTGVWIVDNKTGKVASNKVEKR